MRKRIYIFVNGILCRPGLADHWTDRAVTWIHVNTPYRAEKFEYWSGITTRLIGQAQRGRTLAKMLSFYNPKDWEIVLVGHSNGCDVIDRALRFRMEAVSGEISDQVHYYAPAVIPGPGITTIKHLIEARRLYRFHAHVGGLDRLLQVQERLGRALARIGITYGAIGGMPAEKIAFLLGVGSHARIVSHPSSGHSDYFVRGRPFEQTMKDLVAGL